ncbi:hypothetical protein DF122_21190 [Burkholderia pseudomallei]|uniref:DUF6511 domain-containing protein n=1 Tax=Burkholderia pseudomallei TaxID=28450 RepID=UPI000F4F385D|nr:DUF6511 domain-containing protein [Burkholderia pseudomallei]RPE15464.1 hypothetical protein DF127_23320 [Burkholderia pseudomallei]RPE20085.1 hypothetical protein DF068_21020 [Burkholderia pseudomallei]RQS89271.1 hypothetical protein DF125_22010 [Burkholderia pseudomallei]RQZ48841.1 hypothetical protein DF060_24450 [Burkholderia pseudomallei]RSK62231.1 hypothetical protein DF122_21190 [Burkholderia pseudomallei]
MKCWVCTRQARGFGHADTRHGIGDPRRYPIDWAFCSRHCQDVFHALYGARLRAMDDSAANTETTMIDPSDVERAAMKHCLKAFGEAAGEIGFERPLGDYCEAEALRVIDAIVTCWTDAMAEHHASSRQSVVRGAPQVRDPFADMAEDLPWEATR